MGNQGKSGESGAGEMGGVEFECMHEVRCIRTGGKVGEYSYFLIFIFMFLAVKDWGRSIYVLP